MSREHFSLTIESRARQVLLAIAVHAGLTGLFAETARWNGGGAGHWWLPKNGPLKTSADSHVLSTALPTQEGMLIPESGGIYIQSG